MNISNMKNMVVLKNLPSNIVDEAIIILKGNEKLRKLEYVDSKFRKSNSNKPENNSDSYIVSEAEMLISNYISNIEKTKESSSLKDIATKYKKIKKIAIFLAVIALIQFIILIK